MNFSPGFPPFRPEGRWRLIVHPQFTRRGLGSWLWAGGRAGGGAGNSVERVILADWRGAEGFSVFGPRRETPSHPEPTSW